MFYCPIPGTFLTQYIYIYIYIYIYLISKEERVLNFALNIQYVVFQSLVLEIPIN